MLTYKRRGRGVTEAAFLAKYIETLPDVYVDEFGNYTVEVLNPDGTQATSMFTAHTDSVHRTEGVGKICVDPVMGIVSCGEGNECLGADDATGMYLMINMINKQVPGFYCFFRDEESGGKGSKWFTQNRAAEVAHIHRCISFDRCSFTNDVITEQAYGKCASDQFALRLAQALSCGPYKYTPNDTGIYTDSAEFVDLIPECTNISVGYYNEHGANETQDLYILNHLYERLPTIDWEALEVYREAGDDGRTHATSGAFMMPQDRKLSVLADCPIQDMLCDDAFRFTELDSLLESIGARPLAYVIVQVIRSSLENQGINPQRLDDEFLSRVVGEHF